MRFCKFLFIVTVGFLLVECVPLRTRALRHNRGDSSNTTAVADTDDTGDAPGDMGSPSLPAAGCFAEGVRPLTQGVFGFAMPDLEAERDTYRRLGWSWDAEAEPDVPADPIYNVIDPDIHGDTEGDDLWTYLMQWRRTGEKGYLDRAAAWAEYFKNSYSQCLPDSDSNFCFDYNSYGADHLWGWGLLAWYLAMDDSEALTAATALAEKVDALYGPDTVFGCVPSTSCLQYGTRAAGRHLLFFTRLAEISGEKRWADRRDSIIDKLLTATQWSEEYGMYFSGAYGTDQEMGAGAYDSGWRIQSAFMIGVVSEAMDHAYRVTGNVELRRRMVKMAKFVDDYGLDATYDYTSARIGVNINDGTPFQSYNRTDTVEFWDPVYTTSLVNVLMRGYRYTCDSAYLARAAHFFERGNRGKYGEPVNQNGANGKIHHFVDTIFASSTGYDYLAYNKGELQYTYLLFYPVE